MPNSDSLLKIKTQDPAIRITILVIICLAVANLISSNLLSTKGYSVSDMEKRIIKTEKENRQLMVKIEEAGKMSQLESLAVSYGFIQSKSPVVQTSPNTFASR